MAINLTSVASIFNTHATLLVAAVVTQILSLTTESNTDISAWVKVLFLLHIPKDFTVVKYFLCAPNQDVQAYNERRFTESLLIRYPNCEIRGNISLDQKTCDRQTMTNCRETTRSRMTHAVHSNAKGLIAIPSYVWNAKKLLHNSWANTVFICSGDQPAWSSNLDSWTKQIGVLISYVLKEMDLC